MIDALFRSPIAPDSCGTGAGKAKPQKLSEGEKSGSGINPNRTKRAKRTRARLNPFAFQVSLRVQPG
jgi:hypothetical protein